MAAVITKKVRMDARQAKRLHRLARDLGMTESEVLRQGIDMMERVRDRKRNVQKLIDILGDAPEPPKVRFRTKW